MEDTDKILVFNIPRDIPHLVTVLYYGTTQFLTTIPRPTKHFSTKMDSANIEVIGRSEFPLVTSSEVASCATSYELDSVSSMSPSCRRSSARSRAGCACAPCLTHRARWCVGHDTRGGGGWHDARLCCCMKWGGGHPFASAHFPLPFP